MAEPSPFRGCETFGLSANGDGKLTEDELPEQFRAGFSEVDSNSDGGIDRAELTAAMSKRMQNRAGGGGPTGAGQ